MNKEGLLKILADAISDVGYWSWWIEEFPDIFQIEFDGTQLLNPPRENNESPSGQIALKFSDLVSVAFLTFEKNELDENWPDLLHEDKIDNFDIDYDKFTFTDINLIKELLNEAVDLNLVYGVDPNSIDLNKSKFCLAFRSRNAGLIISANNLQIYNHIGEIKLEEIELLNEKWWDYWREYWDKKHSKNPLPEDYACEVTLPIKS